MSETLNLHAQWLEYVEEFTYKLLDPALPAAGTGGLGTYKPLYLVHHYGLEGALLGLLTTHNTSITFSQGLPILPHDVGYNLWSVAIFDDHIECSVHLDPNQKLSKIQRKCRRFNELVKTNNCFEELRRFHIPITVRFEGGKRK
jgi:hypothetical protein